MINFVPPPHLEIFNNLSSFEFWPTQMELLIKLNKNEIYAKIYTNQILF